MKILVGMPSKDSRGGPIASEPPFVDALRARGHEVVEEVTVYGDGDRPTPTLQRVKRVLGAAFRLRRRLTNENFDIVHLNTAFDKKTVWRDAATIFLMRPRSAKVILKIHGSGAEELPDVGGITRRLIDYLIANVDRMGVHTEEEKAGLVELGFDPTRFSFVKNAVTIADSLPEGFVRRQKEVGERFELLFVSRFIESKGLLESIRACAVLRDRGVDFRFRAVGGGPTMDAAVAEVERLNLGDRVDFTGYIPEEEVTRHFIDSDMLVFPTRHNEGFPNVLFKAVAVGLPVVTTRVRAANDYLKDRENCVFSTQDPVDIADKLSELINDRDFRTRMSASNMALGETLRPANIADEFLRIYEEMLRG